MTSSRDATAAAGRVMMAGMRGISGGAVATYRRVWELPGLAWLTGVGFAARLPVTAVGVVLTLHMVVGLHRGFAEAGLVGGAVTAGIAVGAPLLGCAIDRVGLRPVLAVCAVAQSGFWGAAPALGPSVLTVTACGAGLLTPPAFPVVRQSMAAAVPAAQQRPAFALDAMSVEITYILGPALGTAAVLALPATVALWLVGAWFLAGCVALGRLDPPLTEPSPTSSDLRRRPRMWSGPMLAALAVTAAAILVLSATELAVVATLTGRGQTGWWPLVNAVWGGASLLGGAVYGAAARPRSPALLLGLLAAGSLPVALGGPWWVMALLLVPAGACCAPALAAAAEAVGRLAPDASRGLATGLHGSATTVGATIAYPLSGMLIDAIAPAAATGAAVGIAAVVALLAGRSGRRPGGSGRAARRAPATEQ
ncbi:MFS transporter [Actinomycetospora sp. TBRC 11914]|uniref:MFS transporter n=1 Tax=Actinomycetospora sp. TBRC 11914 TaxID=2729387 RepID=UPI00145ED3D9|nr:MFS transporter [Actinomycetospora sp. TBRC 11914]NMO92596.1 MFS transporter [Actinomycetospora sp. TBRC 11914]